MSDDSANDGPTDDEPRVPSITERDQLPGDQRHHFDAIADSRGGVRGPFSVLLNSPELAGRLAHLGAYVRFESDVEGRLRELVILATAYEWGCAYEWAAHEPIAMEEGVGTTGLDVVTGRAPLSALAEPEASAVQYVRELLGDHDVAEDTYRTVADHLGVRGVTELTATVGYYSMLACVLNGLRVRPDEPTEPF